VVDGSGGFYDVVSMIFSGETLELGKLGGSVNFEPNRRGLWAFVRVCNDGCHTGKHRVAGLEPLASMSAWAV